MRTIFVLIALLMSVSAMAAGPDVCVRNYLGNNPGYDMCAKVGGRYHYVVAQDTPELKICAESYPDVTCDMYPVEYRRALGSDGKAVCVVHYDQPGVGNYCAAYPNMYNYVTAAE